MGRTHKYTAVAEPRLYPILCHGRPMFVAEIIEKLQAVDRLEAKLESSEKECMRLSAGACPEGDNGLIGDEHGHFYCKMKANVEQMERILKTVGECITGVKR